MQSIENNNSITFAEFFIVILLILFTPMDTSIIIYGTQILLHFLLAIIIIIKTQSYQLLNRENILKKIILSEFSANYKFVSPIGVFFKTIVGF